MLIITMVLVVINLLFNNLLINLRFYVKVKSATCGLIFYDFINLITLKPCLYKICRDRCFTGLTFLKWIVKAIVIGITIHLLYKERDEFEEEDFLFPNTQKQYERIEILNTVLILYLLQHPIFIVIRIPLFIIYSIFTCCCDKDETVSEQHNFKERVISLDYIEFELGEFNNFVNHGAGRAELERMRSLRIVRQSIR